MFMKDKHGKVLKKYKRKWIHEKFINKMKVANSKVIRRCRLGASVLAGHSAFMYKNPEKCPCCDEYSIEDNNHYFMKCRKFRKERKDMLMEIKKMKVQLSTEDERELLGPK